MKNQFPLVGLLAWLAACVPTPADPVLAPAELGLPNYAAPLPNVHTSGQPSKEQFDGLAQAGIGRVIHLRAATEDGSGWEEERAAAAGIRFVRLPVAGKDGLTRENVERFAAELAAEGDTPVLVSCASSNRVGALFALKAAWLDGKPAEQALAIGRAAGMRGIEPAVRQLLEAGR